MEISETLRYIYYALLVATLIIGCIYGNSKQNRPIIILIALAILCEVLALLANKVFSLPHTYIYNIYILVETVVILYYLRSISTNSSPFRKIIVITAASFVLLTISLWIFGHEKLEGFPSFIYNISGVIILVSSIIILFQIGPNEGQSLQSISKFWILAGFILFYSGNFALNFFHNYILDGQVDKLETFRLVYMKIVNYILYTFFIIGFLCSPQSKQR